MSFADKTKRLPPAPPTPCPATSTHAPPTSTDAASPSSGAAILLIDDGSSVFVDVDVLRTTANHHLMTQGLVYPTYYRALFPDLRNELTAVANRARDSGFGVWPGDKTTAGFDVTGLDVLEDDVVIVPKLFRRLADYLHLGDDSMAGFPAFLDQAADKFFILSTGHSTTGLDAVVEVTGNTVKMTYPIEDLVFDEK